MAVLRCSPPGVARAPGPAAHAPDDAPPGAARSTRADEVRRAARCRGHAGHVTPRPRRPTSRLAAWLAGGGLLLGGCSADDAALPGADEVATAEVVLLGDSMLAYWRAQGDDVGSVLGASLGRRVANLAVPGAAVLDGDVPSQAPDAQHAWTVLQGGANDLVGVCDGDWREVVDRLVGVEGDGALVDLARGRTVGPGSRVALLGYHRVRPDARFYTACGPAFDLLDARLAALAADEPAMVFVPASDAFEVDDPGWFAPDGYHPSPRGSAELARRLAAAISAAESG